MASNPITLTHRPRDKSKTRVPAKITTTPTTSLDAVLSSLECPVCFETFRPPIFICTLGHNVCGDCKRKLSNPRCPLCCSPITGQRNFTLEEISEKCSSKCSNSAFGCTYIASQEKIAIHLPKCSYKGYLCPLGAIHKKCQWRGLYDELIQHFSSVHPRNIVVKPGLEIKFSNFEVHKPDDDLQLVTLGQNMCFLYHVLIDPKKNLANWAIQKIGSEKTANKFEYEFIFQNYKKCIKSTEECKSDNVPLKVIFETGNCVSIPLHVLKTFINNQKELKFKMVIRAKGDGANINKNFKKINIQH